MSVNREPTPHGKPIRITLCIATRDRPALVERHLLPCLRTLPVWSNAIVVDQSASDMTAEQLNGLDRVLYLRMDEVGLSRARNRALHATDVDLVAFTDDDVSFEPSWLGRIVALFDAHPSAGAVCGGAVTSRGESVPGTPERAGVYRWPHSPFGLGIGLNMALRREAIAAAGLFDEELGAGARFHAAEDTEMLYRVMRAGWSVVCAPDLIVTHQAWRSGRDWLRLQYRYGIGLGAQTAKHARAGERHAVRMGVGIGLRLPPRDRMRPSYALGRLLLSTGMAVGFVRWRRDHRAKNAADAAADSSSTDP